MPNIWKGPRNSPDSGFNFARTGNVMGRGSFSASCEKWAEQVNSDMKDFRTAIMSDLFTLIVFYTPRWTGRAAANWQPSEGSPLLNNSLAEYDIKGLGFSDKYPATKDSEHLILQWVEGTRNSEANVFYLTNNLEYAEDIEFNLSGWRASDRMAPIEKAFNDIGAKY